MSLLIFLVFLAGAAKCEHQKSAWDLAVLTSTNLELLGQTMPHVTPVHIPIKNVSALAYDPFYLHHYFSATGHPNASIFRIQVSRDGRFGRIQPLVNKQPGRIYGLAYDAETTTVFWTATDQILKSQLDLGLTDAQVVHSFENKSSDDRPVAIAVEPCSRYIYWTCRFHSIDRSYMDGSHKERVVEGLFMPVAITISQAERRIYWADEGPGYSYRIGRALLDGSNKEVFFESQYQQPSSIAVSLHGREIYWTDNISKKLWSLKGNNTEPTVVHTFEEPIFAVATADSFDQLDRHVCSELIKMRDQVPLSAIFPAEFACVHGTYSPMSESCVCTPGYIEKHLFDIYSADDNALLQEWLNDEEIADLANEILAEEEEDEEVIILPPLKRQRIGTLCETSICFNFCLNGGTCSMTSGKAFCRCPPGKTGERCEIDSCQGHCFKGRCNATLNGQPSCKCPIGWFGKRCNISEVFCSLACSSGLPELEDCVCNASAAALGVASSPFTFSYDYKTGFIVAIASCGILIFITLLLVLNTCRLRRRPRVKRTYTVNRTKGSSAPEAARTSPDCQIAIENCCNMNICETPCYEPELRQSAGKNKKEEKRGLLREMEVQPDIGKTF